MISGGKVISYPCPKCKGRGGYYVEVRDKDPVWVLCSRCEGTGEAPKDPELKG